MNSMNTSNKFFVCFIHVVVLLANVLLPVATTPSVEEVNTIVENILACRGFPGLSLAVVKDGRLVHAGGYGVKDIENREPVTERTLFGIASLSKAFAATLLVKLLQKHQDFSLETTVKHILGPDFRFHDKLRTNYANLEDLLAHRIGIPSNNWLRLDEKLTRQNLASRIKFLKASGGFRRSFYYSNLMYGLVTSIAEIIGNSTWENLVQTELFNPLTMESSTFSTTADPGKINYAQGYFDNNGSLIAVPWDISRRWGLLCGSGCILSNALDMSKWMMFHLNGGKNMNGDQVLDEDLLMRIHTPINLALSNATHYMMKPETPVSRSQEKYGLGWRIGYYRGFRLITHSGSTHGYKAYLTLIPDKQIGIFTASSGDDPKYFYRMPLHSYLADLYMGTDPWLNQSTLCTYPEPWNPKPKVSPKPTLDQVFKPKRNLSYYEGTYENNAYGSATVFLNDTTDQLVLKMGFASFVLYPKETKDEFTAYGIGWVAEAKNHISLLFKETNEEIKSLQIPDFDITDIKSFHKAGTSGCDGFYPCNYLSVFLICSTYFLKILLK